MHVCYAEQITTSVISTQTTLNSTNKTIKKNSNIEKNALRSLNRFLSEKFLALQTNLQK